jgi:hypothetical protein
LMIQAFKRYKMTHNEATMSFWKCLRVPILRDGYLVG